MSMMNYLIYYPFWAKVKIDLHFTVPSELREISSDRTVIPNFLSEAWALLATHGDSSICDPDP
jgi:hypothetical protein